MGKKLLSIYLLFSIFLLSSWNGFGQCPTSVSISADPGTTICAGTSVTFTAEPNGGSGYLYQWQKGLVDISGATSATYTSSTLSNGDKIRVVIKSSEANSTCSTASSEITMTVNSVLTPSVSVSASKTTICPGENITFNASPVNGGTSPTYIWKVNGTNSGSGNSFSTTSLTNGQSVTVELTSNATCASTTPVSSSSIAITVKPDAPLTPGAISGSADVCPGISSLSYSIAAVANATSYEWTLPSGWSGSSTSNSISVTSGATGSGTISVKAKNNCGTSAAQTFPVNVLDGTPNTPGAITGDAQVCPVLSKTYSIATVSGATTYNWTVPAGWSVTAGAGTNSITVTSGSAGQNGNVSVTAGNSCGTSAAKTLAVSVKAGAPGVPGTISGTGAICPGTTNTYSIAAVANATSYEWILPSGWTGSSTTTSINATSNSTGGNITVKAINDCGTSAIQTLAITIKAGTPATPSAISGSNTVCPNTSETYTITNDANATEYIWTLPNGWTGTSTTSSITVNTGSSGSGNITVKAKNDCGTSAVAATIAVSVKAPAPVMSGTISGPATVCSGSSSLVYTIPAITNATSYQWSLPNGWSGTSTTNSITATAGSSGNISVVAINSCGDSSPSQIFAVNSTTGIPATPGVISTNLTSTAICPVVENVVFSVQPVQNATGYNWILPTGWEITTGANTNSITVKINASQSYASPTTVKVEATNICGKSGISTSQDIFLDNFIVANIGPDLTVCKIVNSIPQLTLSGTMNFGNSNLSPTFTTTGSGSFQNIPSNKKGDFTVNYTPSAADYQAGQVKITMTIPKITSGNNTSCGTGVDEMIIKFKNLPTATITATSPVCSGNTSALTFTGTPNSRVTYKLTGGTNQTVDIGSSGTANVTSAALTTNSTYTLVSSVNLDSPACSNTLTGSTTVTVTPKPTATITYAGAPFCNSLTTGQNPTLTGTNGFTGGTYSSTTGLSIDTSTGAITPSASTPGTYTITYNTKDAGGCAPVTATTQITITKAPTASISYAGSPFCTVDSAPKAVTLTGTDGFPGGTFSAPTGLTINTTTGAITANSSTAGTFTVTYQTPAAGGCSPVSTTTEVTITKAPTVSISYPEGPFCLSDTSLKPVTTTGTDVYTGGTYSAPSGLSINSTTGAITPSASTPGTYEISYKTPASSGCGEVSATTSVMITQTPAAEISYAGPFCTSDDSAQLPAFTNTTGAFEGGTFSVSTNGLDINPASGSISAKNSSPGTYTVEYTFPVGGGCTSTSVSTSVTITQIPQLEISYAGPFCTSGGTPNTVNYSGTAGSFEGGIFSGTAGLSLDANGNINPANSSAGLHTVTYTLTPSEGCGSVEVTTEVEIFKEVVITTQPVNVGICSTEPASLEVVASGDNLTFEWKRTDGAAITNATGITSSKLSFNNATATNAGEYYVEVSGTSPCAMAVSEPVTLNIDENIVIIKPTEDLKFCDQERQEVTFEFVAHAKGAPLTFTWIMGGAEIPGTNTDRFKFNLTGPVGENGEYTGTFQILNPNPSDNGVYAVRINGPDYFTCSNAVSKTFTLNINPLPDPPVTEDLVYCQEATAVPLTASGENGANFQWYNSAMEPIDGVPTPSTLEAGITTYYVTQTTEVCESNPSGLTVTVKPTPAAPVAEQAIAYCHNQQDISPLTASGTNDSSTLNWYGPNDPTVALTAAPTPLTTTVGSTRYWVSETFESCESKLVEITVVINPLPQIAVTADDEDLIICQSSSTILRASGATSFEWFIGENSVSTGSEFTVTPSETTIYKVIGTNDNGCKNTAEITIEVDEPTVAGTISGPASVCISSPEGILTMSGFTGDVVRWEKSIDGGANWTSIQQTTTTLNFTGLSGTTTFRAFVKNGVCDELASNEVTVTIDPLPMGGELSFAGVGRVFTICENPIGDYGADLNLTDITGQVVKWGYRTFNATSFSTLMIGGEVFTGTTLTADQVEALAFNETTVFQVEISSGVCSPNQLSKTAILSVIPSDITPSPVEVDPEVVCLGEEVTLSSETGYENGGTILDQGAFDNASITNHGWRIRRNNNSTDLGFDTDANNTEFDRWKRGTPRAFRTASTTSPYSTSGVLFDTGIESGNKGFGLVSGGNSSTMETPVFSIGATDQAILTFDQAYVLTPGSSIKVEISTDGGNTYQTLYIREVPTSATAGIGSGNYGSFGSGKPESRPENKIQIDLGNYLGFNNLRIRFNYTGTRPGDIWAVDNIDVPEGPRGITLEWRDYTDPAFPEGVFIGTNNSEKWTPTKIGLNTFEVKTKLVFNSNGDACEVEENAQRIDVFVFDKYTTSVTAEYGSCGDFSAQLKATVNNSTGQPITSYPTPDGYIGQWAITGTGYTLVDSNTTDGIDAIKDPNAILSATGAGTFNVSWTLIPTAKNEAGVLYQNPETCPPLVTPLDIIIEGCIALDFDGEDDVIVIDNAYTDVVSIEAWIRPEAAGGTIISGPNFRITTPTNVTTNSRWYHIAVTGGKLYIDGIEKGPLTLGTGGTKTLIGADWTDGAATNHFSGWIEEVRLWKKALTVEQIRFMMNQRLIPNGAQMGEQIPMDVPGGLLYNDLSGYYRLISAVPDPLNLVEFAVNLKPANGLTPNLANTEIPGRLLNMETNQENTAPLPYFSGNNGPWGTDETWARPAVWDPPHTGPIEWNIVRTSHNIQSGQREIKVLGLVSEINTLEMIGTNPGGWVGGGTGNPLYISHYLKLDGVIDLTGESQLLQPMGSIVDSNSSGSLQRDQQGTANSYNYNYWSSPVSPGANNSPYTVEGVLKDGTIPATPGPITFGNPHAFADGGKSTPIKISNYWISTFNGTVNNYGSWNFQYGSAKPIKVGEGFTMKGTSGAVILSTAQNYTFVGLPNNGDINLTSTSDRNYLIGNPYPSAIDAKKFITDNINVGDNKLNYFDGTLYFWDHFGEEDSHILLEYVGGYAVLNLTGAVPAISFDERINDNMAENDKIPGPYIPVGQGFFVNTSNGDQYNISNGEIKFKNSQREFVTEVKTTDSQFLRPEVQTKKIKEKEIEKIRISYKSPLGYRRQILVGAHPSATNGFDIGYDAPLYDYNLEDMYWIQDDNWLVIQGVSNFDEDQVLPLGIVLEKEGEFTIKIDSLENMADGKLIYIRDILNDTIHDLTEVPFVATSEAGYINDRFEIVFHKEEPAITPEEPVDPVVGPIPGKIPPGTELDVHHAHGSRELQILNPQQVDITNLYVYDLNGKLVETYYNIKNDKIVLLPVRNFSSGVYIIKLHAENQMISKKIIINN